jgi:hypothetical protein
VVVAIVLYDLICVHDWDAWKFYQVKDGQNNRYRECNRCGGIQRNDEAEPRVVLMRMDPGI